MISSSQCDLNQYSQAIDISLNSLDQSSSVCQRFQGVNTINYSDDQNEIVSTQSIRIPFNRVEFIQQPIQPKKFSIYVNRQNNVCTDQKISNSYQFYIFDFLLMEATKMDSQTRNTLFNQRARLWWGKQKFLRTENFMFLRWWNESKKCTNQQFYRKYMGSICKNELKCHIPKINQQNNQIYTYSPVYFKKNKEIIQQNNQFLSFTTSSNFKNKICGLFLQKELTSDQFLIKIQKQMKPHSKYYTQHH